MKRNKQEIFDSEQAVLEELGEVKGELETTRLELADTQAALRQALEALEQRAQQPVQEEADNSEVVGWLIRTPNPAYDGKFSGVHFANGQAILYADNPEAKRLLHSFTGELGYEAIPLTGKRANELRQQIALGVEKAKPGRSIAEALQQTQVMGMVES